MEAMTVEGRVTKTVPKSGVIERCPECDRVVHNGHCVVHVDADPEPDLRLKGKVEGYDQVVVVNTDLAEDILDISLDEAQVLPESDLLNLIRTKFVDNYFEFEGRTLSDNFIADDARRRQ